MDEAALRTLLEGGGGVRDKLRDAVARQVEHLGRLAAASEPATCAPVAAGALAGGVLAALDPEITLPARALAQLGLAGARWEPDDPIEPVMAAPEFPTPMYRPLKQLSQDWLMPGLKDLPQNTLTVAETNARFVEAYMAGLNHEMGRELLWRDFPTDQRGTYFRQFWDPAGRVPAPATDAEREAAKDIGPIHRWDRGRPLGAHVSGGAGSGELVLVIRGDLLRRFPRATICLQRAAWSTDGAGSPAPPRVLADPSGADAIRFPIFGASLDPDVSLLGFDLAATAARGKPSPSAGDPGWFVVFQEQPTEPRFGFGSAGTAAASPSDWSGIDWAQVATTAGHVDLARTAAGPAKQVLDAVGAATGITWGAQAAAMAAICLQRPFRLAIHADDMLP